MKTYVIGDIHGGLLALQQVLKAVNFDYEKDTLIALGDVTDGWPDVAESIEELLKIKNLVYIKGNHDEWTERWLRQFLEHGPKMSMNGMIWYQQGGKATIESYKKNPDLVDKHLKFLEDAKLYHLDDENRIFMHAGFNPDVPLEDQYQLEVGQKEGENATFYWDRSFWGRVIDSKNWGKKELIFEEYKEIYIGHTPTINYIKESWPMKIGNVINMDSGATYDGRLSIMDLDSREITQSDPVYTLYPDHMGRNGEYLAKKEE